MTGIRRLTEADRPAWRALRLALWPRNSEAEFDADISLLLAKGDLSPTFGAFDGKDLIGFAEASERPWGDGCETAPVAWLEGIYVADGHRRQGAGRLLVENVVAWARDRGLSELGSDAAIDNAPSLHSHKRWGFVETKCVVMFRRKLT